MTLTEESTDQHHPRITLLLKEYEVFDGRLTSLMIRMSGVVAGGLALSLPPFFKGQGQLTDFQTFLLALLFPIILFVMFQITSQMLVYKRHMTHLARELTRLDPTLELQWDLIYFDRIYHPIPSDRPIPLQASLISIAVGLLFPIALLGYFPIFRDGLEYARSQSTITLCAYYIVALTMICGGPILLIFTRRTLNRAYLSDVPDRKDHTRDLP